VLIETSFLLVSNGWGAFKRNGQDGISVCKFRTKGCVSGFRQLLLEVEKQTPTCRTNARNAGPGISNQF